MDDTKTSDDPFVTDSNKAVRFKLIRTVKDIENDDLAFEPEMSHQIFGVQEKIYGYKDLSIKLYFTASTLQPYLAIDYKERVCGKGQTSEPDDIEAILVEKLEIIFERNIDNFVKKLQDEPKFRPMGELKNLFTIVSQNNIDKVFEIYQTDIFTSGFKNYHERLQTFILWFIDAASFIDFDDSKWIFFVIYEKYKQDYSDMYAVAGYAAVYEYYAYPEHIRPRISQVLIFPPFQGHGLGAKLIETIYAHYRNNSSVKDITVEDASVDLQAIRDYVDCKLISETFPDFSKEKIDEVSQKLKLNRKQVVRVSEILQLRDSNNNKEKYEKFRNIVKNRLYLPLKIGQQRLQRAAKFMSPQDFELLKSSLQLSEETKKDTLDKAYNELEEQYSRVVDRLNGNTKKKLFKK